MPEAKSRLTSLSIEEGSFVDAGDNPGATINLFKRAPVSKDGATPTTPVAAEGATPAEPESDAAKARIGFFANLFSWAGMTPAKKSADAAAVAAKYGEGYGYSEAPRTVDQILAQDSFYEESWRLKSALMRSINAILSQGDQTKIAPMLTQTVAEFDAHVHDLVDELQKRSPEAASAFQDIVRRLVESTADKTAKSSRPDDRARFAKALADLDAFEVPVIAKHEQPETEEPTVTNPKNVPAAKSLDDILAAMPEAERAVVAAKLAEKPAAVEPAQKVAPVDDGAVAKKLEDLEKRAADAESSLKKMQDEKEEASFLAKAKDIGNGDVAEIAKVLRGAYAVSKESGEALEKVLRASAAQVAKAAVLTKAIGSESTDASSPEGQLEARAKELQAKEGGTFAQAYTKVLKGNPELANAALS